jgi:hypothetical protein
MAKRWLEDYAVQALRVRIPETLLARARNRTYTVAARDLPRRRMMPARTRIPKFKSEREEAEWRDAHPDVVTALFLKAKMEGKIKRLPAGAMSKITRAF